MNDMYDEITFFTVSEGGVIFLDIYYYIIYNKSISIYLTYVMYLNVVF